MKYSMAELFDFMYSGRKVKVTTMEGEVCMGRCWAYSAGQNEEEYGVDEPALEVGPGAYFFASEIESIEFVD